MIIRPERPGDADAIHDLTARAFAPTAYSSGAEPAIIHALRVAGDLTLSLVAEEDGAIIGHVAFSPVTVESGEEGWFGLGPVSVEPSRQRQGIGRTLIAEGLAQLKRCGAAGCALIGNPEVYRPMGFVSDGRLHYGEVDTALVQRMVFRGPAPQGALTYSSAFNVSSE